MYECIYVFFMYIFMFHHISPRLHELNCLVSCNLPVRASPTPMPPVVRTEHGERKGFRLYVFYDHGKTLHGPKTIGWLKAPSVPCNTFAGPVSVQYQFIRCGIVLGLSLSKQTN